MFVLSRMSAFSKAAAALAVCLGVPANRAKGIVADLGGPRAGRP